ncbi:hypothetical protein Tcan_06789 [Toxocara canis]|uniref:Uncharacterized protein n=1 Tax=Toxocara canis TaxID=6265 RepID=A0A0B2VDH3_TOXCA|nr:hypothetical protein Tcan_06789 [Toxocara canis]
MSAWLRNLQGQLTELASEVLTEATEEVDGTESELQFPDAGKTAATIAAVRNLEEFNHGC